MGCLCPSQACLNFSSSGEAIAKKKVQKFCLSAKENCSSRETGQGLDVHFLEKWNVKKSET